MFLGLAWYWWLVIAAVLVVSVPFKLRFMRWWNESRQEKKESRQGRWGDEE